MDKRRSRTTKVGVFVLVGLILATVVIFLIGDNRRLWERKISLRARFTNVAGLKSGAPVRIGGLDVGSVTEVSYSSDPSNPYITVTFSVARDEATRVKPDSVARISGRGLLGDKMIEITGGSPAVPPAPDGSTIASEPEPADLGQALGDIQEAAKNAKESLRDVKIASERLADKQFYEDLHGSVAALRTILDGVATKPGAAHDFVFDAEEAKKIQRILANLDAASANLAAASADAHDVMARAKTGPGLAHTLVYDDKTAESVSGSMAELHGALKGIRTGNGLAHAFVYGDETENTQKVMTNITAMSDDLRKIVADVRAGKGTVGALLVDPSVYEDIKSLVGNVERNQVLRALVRYSIKQNEEQRPHADVKDEGKAQR
jgi:phospholipid/cholesterol/gamma-HCH transport system substrate-binding protein